MHESSKARARRIREQFFQRYIAGRSGIDIGCGPDPITADCRTWDLQDGDAQLMEGAGSEVYDWVYSSHCLEHVRDPRATLQRWWELVRPGGHLLVMVPDEDLYEQGVWPSTKNPDHKHTFTIFKSKSWSPVSVNVIDLVRELPRATVHYVRRADEGYLYELLGSGIDQSMGFAEVGIEFVVEKQREG